MFAMHQGLGLSLLTVGCLAWVAGSGPACGQDSPQSEIVVDSLSTDVSDPVTLVVDEEQRFRASAMLRIRADQPRGAAESSAAENADRFVRTQVNLLRSRVVLDRVIADPDIANLDELKSQQQPLDYLGRHLRVSSVENSELFLVTFDGKTPDAAAKIANAVLESFRRIQSDQETLQRQAIVDLLDQEMDRRTRELERLRHSLRALTKAGRESETTGPDGKRRPQSEAVQQMWLQAWREEMELAARVQALEETGPAQQAELAQVRLELRTKRNVLERLSTVMNDQMAAREKASGHELDAEFLRQDMARAEANYKAIVDRAEALKLEIRGSNRVGETRRARAGEAKLVLTPRAN